MVGKEIVIDIKPKENKLKIYLPFLAVAVLLAGLFFIIGFGLGKHTEIELPLLSEETATKSATRKGWFVYETKGFSIEYPKHWEVKLNSKEEPEGGKVLGGGGKIEFWSGTIKVYKFTKEQKSKQSGTQSIKLTIDGRKSAVTEYSYKKGDFFIVVEVPEKEKKPKVLFWIIAANKEYKKIVMEIISTFKTNGVTGNISSLK